VFVCVLREMCVWLLLFGFLFVGMGMGSFLTSFCECVVFLCLEVEFFFLCFWLFLWGLFVCVLYFVSFCFCGV